MYPEEYTLTESTAESDSYTAAQAAKKSSIAVKMNMSASESSIRK